MKGRDYMDTQFKLLTIRQAANLVDGFTEYQIRRLIKNGKLPYLKSGNRVLIEKQAIYNFVATAGCKDGEAYE